jgi:hypothetical protein
LEAIVIVSQLGIRVCPPRQVRSKEKRMTDCCSRLGLVWLGLRRLSVVALALLFALSLGAGPAWADDDDGDGHDTPEDCDDSNANVHPGATEICNGIDDNCVGGVDELVDPDPVDDLDNDGDGLIDEGFGSCLFAESGPAGECKTGGRSVCQWPAGPVISQVAGFGTLTCAARPGVVTLVYADETIAGGNCGDSTDNDCDGSTDILDAGCQSPEVCDGLDNDGDGTVDDGFNVGAACSAGVGECLRNGVFLCNGPNATICSVSAGSPKNEGGQFGNTCANGDDDDCDGDTDLDDAGCAGFGNAELCGNNLDDDGDGQIDEGFATIGLPCSVGTGTCAANGVFVCNGAGTGTVCGATAGAPGTETAAAGTCADFVDNDCDGFTDKVDVDCAEAYADLGVTCSLPYRVGKPGADCGAWHFVTFAGGQATSVKADLLALDSAGNQIGIIENVQNGDWAHLLSRKSPDDFRVDSKVPGQPKNGSRHSVFAPIPLLRVTGTKGSVEDVAYCGILPYLEVTNPNGMTISLSEGNEVSVQAFLPLVDVDTLAIRLDGQELLSALGINAATQFPTGGGALCTTPGSCVIQVPAGCGDGSLVDVQISNLRVEGLDTTMTPDARNGVEEPDQVNTISFTVKGLPAGGHMFHVAGHPLPLPRRLSAECNLDDLADSGALSAFGIAVDKPFDQEIVASAPVTVEGTVCSGNAITALRINGRSVDVTSPGKQTCTPGDGVFTTQECVVDFSEQLPEKDLGQAIVGNAENASYKRGSNRVIADAADDHNNRTFNTEVIFGLGAVQQPEPAMAMLAALPRESGLDKVAMDVMDAVTTTIDPAFVVGLDEVGVQKFFNAKCADAIQQFTDKATATLQGKDFATVDIDPDCSCAVSAKIVLETLTFTPTTEDPVCAVDFSPGEIDVTIHLPDIFIQVGAHDSCTDHGLFGECIARTKVNVTAQTFINDISFSFNITETQIETKSAPDTSQFVYTWDLRDAANRPAFTTVGHCEGGPLDGRECYGNKKDVLPPQSAMCEDFPCVGADRNEDFDPVTHQDVGIECWGASICLAFEAIAAVFITVFTFGLVDGFDLIGFLDFDVDFNEDFLDELTASEPDAMALDEVEVDEDRVSQAGHTTFTAGQIDVEIENGGLTVAFPADFTIQSTDPDIPVTPPPPATDARTPTIAEVTAVGSDVTMLIADDVFGQVFAAMRTAGLLQAVCTNLDGTTIGDLIPADCNAFAPDNVVGAELRGICHAIRGADCQALTDDQALQQAAMRGACEGFKPGGTPCADLPGGQVITCNLTPPRNIQAGNGLLLCARQDMEPDLLIKDDNTADGSVLTDLTLEDINVVFAIDRGADGYTGKLEDLPGCMSDVGDAAADCRVVAVCADLILHTSMGIDSTTCAPRQAGFVFALIGVDPASNLDIGAMCAAATEGDDKLALLEAIESKVIETVSDRAEAFTPPICVDGLDLNGVLDFSAGEAKLFGLTTDGATGAGFADYLGITVGLLP